MSRKHTSTLTVEFSLPEERDDLVIGEIPSEELPALRLTRKLVVSLNDGPERLVSARQARRVLGLIDELKDSALTKDGQIVLNLIAGSADLENLEILHFTARNNGTQITQLRQGNVHNGERVRAGIAGS